MSLVLRGCACVRFHVQVVAACQCHLSLPSDAVLTPSDKEGVDLFQAVPVSKKDIPLQLHVQATIIK